MNQFKNWQIGLIYSVLIIGIIFAMPNFYPTKPALQVAFGASSSVPNTNIIQSVTSELESKSIEFEKIELDENSLKIIFDDVENQLAARRTLAEYSDGEFIIALNSEPSTPEWLRSLGGKPVNLGLDLAGGIHFLLEVDTERYSEERLSSEGASLVEEFLSRNINASYVSTGSEMKLSFSNTNNLVQAREYLDQNNFITTGSKYAISQNGNTINLQYTNEYLDEIIDYAVEQNLVALRNRVNELGVSEPIVQRQGTSRIVVELPGVQDSTSAKKIIGKTANLEFRLQARPDEIFLRKEQFSFKSEPGKVFLEKVIILTGDNVTNAQSGFDENGRPQVNINLDIDGGKAMQNATKDNIGRNLGVLLIEEKTKTYFDENDNVIQAKEPVKQVISNANIKDTLGTSFRITGLGSSQEASELALLLRAGALAAPMTFVEEQTIGPSLGEENIEKGINSVIIGFILVFIFMLIRYRLFGLSANIALMSNLILVTAIMSAVGATLTLPGIAGIVLTVGMAVDANVLIFARISEELKANVDPQNAIRNGFSKAFSTIMDANITTLLVALILYAIGTGPIKGFAVTLSIGIVTSIFTAILVTRSLVNFIYGYRRVEELKI
ncbi:MAG: protein translocase subunit SecD [Rickettsiales bacterium TMED289]|nr:protein translocase subunit SecD [Gammaproteobacteria bacterium]MAJ89971.1 protein translocase subunit SecD [Flavobacteriales bacterium]RPF74465.1 MAG: protein translocase subunit SecD [Rickettsiales bacterium TMED289]